MLNRTLVFALWVSLSLTAVAWCDTTTLEDFDGPFRLGQRWTAIGDITVERVNVPKPAADVTPGLAGKLVRCRASSGSAFVVSEDFPGPGWLKADAVRFHIRVPDQKSSDSTTMEFRVYSRDRRASLWRKFQVRSNEWQVIELPLHFFRYSTGASVGWSEVKRFGFQFRDAVNVEIDGIELISDGDGSPNLTPEELGRLAFGDAPIFFRSDQFVLITNDDRVAGDRLLTEFQKLRELVYADFPDLPKPRHAVMTLVFATKSQYQQFWPKFSQKHASVVAPVRSNGFSLLGVAGSYFSAEFGPVRPVWIHETCHALLGPALGLSNASEWLHEGLANHYQLNWTKQNLRELHRSRLASGSYKPLSVLTNGKRLRLDDYAQATHFVGWLLANRQRKQQLSSAMTAMRKRCSTELEPICEEHFGMSIDALELEWLRSGSGAER